jgi:NAD(P)-dependent dehydrogenase (short-subunit alcohol dehydrogenase family)
MEFSGKTVLITGAAGNLGRAVAGEFAGRGASLVLVDRSREVLEKAFGAASRSLLAPIDLLEQSEVNEAVKNALDHFGRIDALINLAGGFRMGSPVHETSDVDWNFMLELNAGTVLRTARAVVPAMLAQGGGKIVSVGAYAALKGSAAMGAYIASKSAVIRLTESLSSELRDKGINVNCVLPTILDTPENRTSMPKADPGRWVAPGDLANVICFLASDEARAIHGAAVPVTGLS